MSMGHGKFVQPSTFIPAQAGIQIRSSDQDVKKLFDKRSGVRVNLE